MPNDLPNPRLGNQSDTGFGERADYFVRQRALLSRYDQFIVEQFGRYLGSRLLEVGCGIGNMTRLLLNRDLVVTVDSSPENIGYVKSLFGQNSNFACYSMDILHPSPILRRFEFDSALCANVLEHIVDDEKALKQVGSVLGVGGTLVIIVPSGPQLYCSLDFAAGHVRRYSLQRLQEIIRGAGFVEIDVRALNVIGILGWLLNGKVAHRATVPDWQLRLFNSVAGPWMAIESRLHLRSGLSIVAVCRKK